MGPGLSQKCVAGLFPQSPPSKLMEKNMIVTTAERKE